MNIERYKGVNVMIQREFVLKGDIHARPATYLVNQLLKYQSDVYLIIKGNRYNAKSVLSLMSLELMTGDTVFVEVSGIDEERAMEGIESFVVEYQDEDDI